MDIGVLGPLLVVNDGRDCTPAGRLQRAVLLRLLVDANRVVPVHQLADAAFDGRQPQNPGAAIQRHISRLRQTLTCGRRDGDALFTKSALGYRLSLEDETIDASRFERLVAEANKELADNQAEAAAGRLTTALGLWRGPALGEFAGAVWAHGEVARLEELRLDAVESLVEARLAIGGHHELVAELQALAGDHPLRERIWAQLMRALYLDGRQGEALRAYQQARRVLGEDLGLDPGRELQDLERAILVHDPALHARTSTAVAGTAGASSRRRQLEIAALARPLTTFVGREDEIVALTTMSTTANLVTLTGLAGVGKTRLATEVAAQRSAADPALEVRLVELAALADQSLVAAEVAAGVLGPGSQEGVGRDLAGAIGDRHLLVVVDNCEHLRDGCAELAMALLGRCPNLRILATSQQALDVPGEVVWPVPPLSLPPFCEADDPAPTPDELVTQGAVRLFCDRAVLVRPEFRLTAANGAAVATICRRLDGLPLAIELAAAAGAMLSVWEIAELLDDRFNLLTTSSRWVTGRHRTLLAAVDWSHGLLSSGEQVLLRRLAVFAGGTTLGAAEEVCADEHLAASGVFDALTGLVGKSLVVADTDGHQARYRLLETVRSYAADRLLEAGEHAAMAERHLLWCVGFAERAETELFGPGEAPWRHRLQGDLDNIRAALTWALAERRAELALRLAGALGMFWVRQFHADEGRRWLERALAVAGAGDTRLRARAWWSLALVGDAMADAEVARASAGESLELWRRCQEPHGAARALLLVAWNPPDAGADGADDPMALLDEAAGLARQSGDSWCLSQVYMVAGQRERRFGRYLPARGYFENAAVVARTAGLAFDVIHPLLLLGFTAMQLGDYAAAEAALHEAEDRSRQTAAATLIEILVTRADLAIRRGRHDAARPLLDEALEMAVRFTVTVLILRGHMLQGQMALAEGDLASAERSAAAVGDVVPQLGQPAIASLVFVAEVHLARGEVDRARPLLAQALDNARAQPDPLRVAEVMSCIAAAGEINGQVDSARSSHRWALEHRNSAGAVPDVVRSLESIALLLVDHGDPERPARLLAAAATLRAAGGYAPPPVLGARIDTALETLRGALGDEGFAAAWAGGSELSLTGAVALASADADPADR